MMNKKHSPLFWMLVACAVALLSGCNSDKRYAANKETQFLGIMKSEPASYNLDRPASVNLHTDEITSRQDVSGDEVSLFWGLLNFKDS